MQALWAEPWLACAPFVDGNEVVPFRGDVSDLWLRAKQSTADVKASLCRKKTKWRCRQFAKVRNPPFRICWGFDPSLWLFTQCFRAHSPNPAERIASINWPITHQSRKRNFGRQSSTSSSCVRKAGKERQNASRGTFSARFSERPAAQPRHWWKM